MKRNAGAAVRVIAILGLVAMNLFVLPRALSAAADDKYCKQDENGRWACSDGCPPQGCNCSCSANCVNAACDET